MTACRHSCSARDSSCCWLKRDPQLVVSDGIAVIVADGGLQRVDGAGGVVLVKLYLTLEDQGRINVVRVRLQVSSSFSFAASSKRFFRIRIWM